MNEPRAIFAAVDRIYETFSREEHVPGLVAGVVQDGRLAHLTTYGVASHSGSPAGADTVFRIASMTKNTTALAILSLRDAGLFELDAPIARYVPELAGLAALTADSRPMSARDLLTHTAGFVTDDPWGDRLLGMPAEAFSDLLASNRLFARAPGLGHEYSNLGYAVLGRAITNVAGRPYQQFIGETLLAPLGMDATTFDFNAVPDADRAIGHRWSHDAWSPEPVEADGAFGAMGGLATTARDYARYVAFLLDAWPARDDPERGPVRRSTVRELAQMHAQPQPVRMRDVDGTQVAAANAYGYGMVSTIDDRLGRFLHHMGGLPGYGSHVVLSTEAGVGLFVFANVTYAPVARASLAVAEVLREAGVWRARDLAVSSELSTAVEALVRAYAAGQIGAAAPLLAENLLLDEPAADWDARLAALKARFGEGLLQSIEPRHRLAGRFVIACAGGLLTGEVALTPGPVARIQSLSFETA